MNISKVCIGLMCLLSVFTSHAALRIGVLFFDPPLVISASQGFHVDLAHQICAGLKQECIIKPMKWDQLFIALDKGEIDLQMGVYITPERAKNYIFTIPYLVSKGRLFGRTKNHFTSISQLQGKTLGTLKEENEIGVFHKYINNTYPNVFKIVNFDNISNLVTALADNTIQVGFLHAASADYWLANSSGEFSPIGGSFLLGAGYSLMALPSNQALVNAVDEQLKLILKSEAYHTIYTMYLDTP